MLVNLPAGRVLVVQGSQGLQGFQGSQGLQAPFWHYYGVLVLLSRYSAEGQLLMTTMQGLQVFQGFLVCQSLTPGFIY